MTKIDPLANAEATLRLMKSPELSRLLHGASKRALRAFAVACGGLAVTLTEWDQPPGVPTTLRRLLDIAGLLVQDVLADDPDIRDARNEARALAKTLDDAQLDLLGVIEEASEKADIRTAEHPRYRDYTAACHCHRAADIVANALHEDPFLGAVECAYTLEAGLRIDMPTVIALARVAALDHAG